MLPKLTPHRDANIEPGFKCKFDMRVVQIGDLRGELRPRGQENMPLFKEPKRAYNFTMEYLRLLHAQTRSIIFSAYYPLEYLTHTSVYTAKKNAQVASRCECMGNQTRV